MANNLGAGVKGKEKKMSSTQFAKGGTTKMFEEGGANTAQPGVSHAPGGSPSNKFGIPPGAGKGHTFGPQVAEPSKPGVAADPTGKDPATNQFKVAGGKTKMFGFSPAKNQTPA